MKRNNRLSMLLLLAAVPLGALAADPQVQQVPKAPADYPPATGMTSTGDWGSNPAPLFKELDANHDGYISKDEAKRSADVTARFNRLDANHDGRISVDEFNKGMQPKP